MIHLEVNKISKSFRGKRVLEDVSFSVKEGRTVAITGENGSGKTTLLNLIAGWIKPDSGIIRITPAFGYCPQETLFFPRLTVSENIDYFHSAYRYKFPALPDSEIVAKNLLKTFSFENYFNYKAGTLSGGTKQKLNLVLSLLHNPDIMILDEPYSSFDRETYLKFWDYTVTRKREGKSLLIVSHLIYDESFIDELYIIKDQRLECA